MPKIFNRLNLFTRQNQLGFNDLGRTKGMQDNIKRWPEVKKNSSGDYQFRDYRLISRHIENFNQKIASAGSGNREIIILDPASPTLQSKYNDLKQKIGSERNVEKILDILSNLVAETLADTNTDGMSRHWQGNYTKNNQGKKIPVISLGEFIRQGKGVCRHRTLLAAYLTYQLIQEGILPAGKVHHNRDDLDRNDNDGAHTWAMYQPTDSRYGHYVIDAMWKMVENIQTQASYLAIKYGVQPVKNMLDRYKIKKSIGNDYNKLFATLIFAENNEKRLKMLEQIWEINPIDLALFKLRKFHGSAEVENKRVTLIQQISTARLSYHHTISFQRLAEENNHLKQRQFIVGLLLLDETKRQQVIAEQLRKSPNNLALLRKAIQDDRYYLEKPHYFDALLKDINRHIENHAQEQVNVSPFVIEPPIEPKEISINSLKQQDFLLPILKMIIIKEELLKILKNSTPDERVLILESLKKHQEKLGKEKYAQFKQNFHEKFGIDPESYTVPTKLQVKDFNANNADFNYEDIKRDPFSTLSQTQFDEVIKRIKDLRYEQTQFFAPHKNRKQLKVCAMVELINMTNQGKKVSEWEKTMIEKYGEKNYNKEILGGWVSKRVALLVQDLRCAESHPVSQTQFNVVKRW